MDLKATGRQSNSVATDSGYKVSDYRTGQGKSWALPTIRLQVDSHTSDSKMPWKQAEIRWPSFSVEPRVVISWKVQMEAMGLRMKNNPTWIRGMEIAFHSGFWIGDGQRWQYVQDMSAMLERRCSCYKSCVDSPRSFPIAFLAASSSPLLEASYTGFLVLVNTSKALYTSLGQVSHSDLEQLWV